MMGRSREATRGAKQASKQEQASTANSQHPWMTNSIPSESLNFMPVPLRTHCMFPEDVIDVDHIVHELVGEVIDPRG